MIPDRLLESVREHHVWMHSFRSMSRIEASRRNARALQLRHSQSFANRRQRLSHAKDLSTSQRFGKTANPLAQSERLTIATLTCAIVRFTAA